MPLIKPMTRLEKFYHEYLRNPFGLEGDISWYCEYKDLPDHELLFFHALDCVVAEDKEYQKWKEKQNFSDLNYGKWTETERYAKWAKFGDTFDDKNDLLLEAAKYFISKDQGYKAFRKKKKVKRLKKVLFFIIAIAAMNYMTSDVINKISQYIMIEPHIIIVFISMLIMLICIFIIR